jgi:GntR family transcriptional repressor for pyruvate dehydrogenase complex
LEDVTSIEFESVAPRGRLADHVAAQIEKSIVEGRLTPGAKLPTEAELCDQFNVSRTVIREAMQQLASRGLVETRRGRGVGTTVLPFSRDFIVSSLSRFLGQPAAGVALQHLHQVRFVLELATARLAALSATEADLADLSQLLHEMEQVADAPEMLSARDAEFHRTLARATHNPLMVVLIDSMRDLLEEYIRATLPHVDIRREVIPYHREVFERVAARDPQGAQQAMSRHLTSTPWEKTLGADLLEDGTIPGR